MKSTVVKRSIDIAGHKTSVSLEDAFWKGLKEIADGRDITLSDLIAAINSRRLHGNLDLNLRPLLYFSVMAKEPSQSLGREISRSAVIRDANSE